MKFHCTVSLNANNTHLITLQMNRYHFSLLRTITGKNKNYICIIETIIRPAIYMFICSTKKSRIEQLIPSIWQSGKTPMATIEAVPTSAIDSRMSILSIL